jgi:HEAT repeat protein
MSGAWRRRHRGAAALVLCALAGDGIADGDPADPATAILTAIDVAPSAATYEAALGPDADEVLRSIAVQDPVDVDPGVRVRALRGLAAFPSPVSLSLARAVVDAPPADEADGAAQLARQAAVEALGYLGDAGDLPRLVVQLEFEPNRDLRERAARALARIGDAAAVQPLRERLEREDAAQVQLAIVDALRSLEE